MESFWTDRLCCLGRSLRSQPVEERRTYLIGREGASTMPRRSSERIKDCPPAGKAVCRFVAGREPVTRCPLQPDAHFTVLLVSFAESNGGCAFDEGTRPHVADPFPLAGQHKTASTALRPYPPCRNDKSGQNELSNTLSI